MSLVTVPVILAGGFGTRIKHLLPNTPKPMALVNQKPFIEWILLYLQAQGFSQSLLSTGYLGHLIEAYFGDHWLDNFDVLCYQELVPLGTAGGFRQAVEQSELKPDNWLVMNGDSLVCTPLDSFLDNLVDDEVDGVILGVEQEDASRYGLLQFDEDHRLQKFVEKRPGSGIINGGVYLFRSYLLEEFPLKRPLSFEEDVFPVLLANKANIKVHIVNAPFLDIGTPESLSLAEQFILQPSFMNLLTP